MSKRILSIFVGAIVLLGLYGISVANSYSRTATAYMAKVLCSEIFLANRNYEILLETEFNDIHPLLAKVSTHLNKENKTITASIFGLGKSKAVYRDGYGCSLAVGKLVKLPSYQSVSPKPWLQTSANTPHSNPRINYNQLQTVVDEAFKNNELNHRALLVAVDGELAYEQYAEGFNESTPLLSWSAAKSVIATLIGIGVHKSYLDVEQAIPVSEWKNDSSRSKLTWDNLLRMQSGLDFTEDYSDPRSDVNKMLFNANSMAAVAAKSPLTTAPETKWYYSSGSSNILSRAFGDVVENHDTDIFSFARENLFAPLGLSSVTLETDSNGDFIGSSYVYATAQDWLKMGQLYLQDGVWEGNRILPEDWDEYVSKPTLTSNGSYGAHFWINRDGNNNISSAPSEIRTRNLPGLPESVYFFAGRDGQYVIIIPDKNMVIARMGITRDYPILPKIAPLFVEIYNSVSSL